jgi:hypothetical protein
VMSALLPKADIEQASPDVCYGPILLQKSVEDCVAQ